MMADVGRLRERVLKLQQHYGQAGEDMRQILISTEKIGARASRIDELDFGDSDAGDDAPRIVPAPPTLKLEAGE
jgi:DNA recombination protein RmuC